MKTQFLAQLLAQPWNIDRLRARTIIGHLAARLRASSESEASEPCPPPAKMQRVGDVAIVPLRGAVGMNLPYWCREEGWLADANDTAAQIEEASADPALAMIVLDVDSPGGLSLAGDKLFDTAEAARRRKPVFAWCADGAEMCSTAYEASASATAILTGRYASAVGCIGSYIAYLDDTQFLANLGFAFQVFRSGELKALGVDGLSEEQAAYLQSLVDSSGEAFRARVLKYRTDISPDDMRGQWFTGDEAAARGFTAGTAKDLSAAIAKFRRMI